MKYLILIFVFASCNAITLFTNDKSRIDEALRGEERGSNQQNNLVCPANYSRVSGNGVFGTNDFCVMKFEAKDFSGVATSDEIGTPWTTGISLNAAKNNCLSLGSGFDLISNPEWMTVAAEIELNPNNWDTGTVGSGCIFRGNTGESTSCGYDGANPEFGATTGRDPKARHFLKNGQEVWDLSGNVQEWVDWTLGGTADTGPTSCTGADIELSGVACAALAAIDYLPQDTSLSSAEGVGKFFGGSGGSIIRGGTFLNLDTAGLYRLTTNGSSTNTAGGFGFRCVYRGSP